MFQRVQAFWHPCPCFRERLCHSHIPVLVSGSGCTRQPCLLMEITLIFPTSWRRSRKPSKWTQGGKYQVTSREITRRQADVTVWTLAVAKKKWNNAKYALNDSSWGVPNLTKKSNSVFFQVVSSWNVNKHIIVARLRHKNRKPFRYSNEYIWSG